MAILPVPTSRVSTLLAQQRLMGQVQNDQLALIRLQTQVSTGRRVISPSDDAPAALRAINIQRILERKTQALSSLQNSSLYLSAADTALAQVTNVLNDIKGAALGVSDTISTHEARQAVVDQVDRALESLIDAGNSKFRDRYLFSGSRSLVPPYAKEGNFVDYRGNESTFRSYVDLDYLLDTNLPGTDVFGGLSKEVRGRADLDPQLTRSTQLQHLNGGTGISRGAVEIVYVNSAGTATSSVVDLSRASTIDDVARYFEQGVPPGSGIRVEVTGSGLELSTPSTAEGVYVLEVAEGRTARELGIYRTTAQSTLVGDDISPVLTPTTRLDDLLGRKAVATVTSAGDNNDLLIRATRNGGDFEGNPLNGVTIQFTDTATAGSETAVYDPSTATLTIAVEAGKTTARQVVAAINAEPTGLFTASIDPRDSTSTLLAGESPIDAGVTAETANGSGEVLDQTSGLLVTNGGTTETIDISGAETVEQLLNILNRSAVGLVATINSAGTGIDIRSRLSGANLSIGEVGGGQTATQLGVRSMYEGSRLADFNRGKGVLVDGVDDMVIELTTGATTTTYPIDLDGAVRVEDLMSAINAQTGGAVTARLADHGNGITFESGADSITVRGQVARQLGFFGDDVDQATGPGILSTDDRHTLEVDSVFNTLLRLRTALQNDDIPGIGDALGRLEEDFDRINFARSEIGARLQYLDTLQTRHEDEEVTLRSALSEEIEVDMAQAISEFTGRQYALQASLRTSASVLQMTILDFI